MSYLDILAKLWVLTMSKIMLFKTWFWKEHLVLVYSLKRKKNFQCGVKNNFLNSLNLILKNSKNIGGWFVLKLSLVPPTFHSTKINNLFKGVSTFMEVRSWCRRKLGNNIVMKNKSWYPMKQCIRQCKAPFIFLGARKEGPIFMVSLFLKRGNQWIDNKFIKDVTKWESSWGFLELLGHIPLIHWTSVSSIS